MTRLLYDHSMFPYSNSTKPPQGFVEQLDMNEAYVSLQKSALDGDPDAMLKLSRLLRTITLQSAGF